MLTMIKLVFVNESIDKLLCSHSIQNENKKKNCILKIE